MKAFTDVFSIEEFYDFSFCFLLFFSKQFPTEFAEEKPENQAQPLQKTLLLRLSRPLQQAKYAARSG